MTGPTSYPFLSLARLHGADYGDVLAYADFCAADRDWTPAMGALTPTYWQTKSFRDLEGRTMYRIERMVIGIDAEGPLPRIA